MMERVATALRKHSRLRSPPRTRGLQTHRPRKTCRPAPMGIACARATTGDDRVDADEDPPFPEPSLKTLAPDPEHWSHAPGDRSPVVGLQKDDGPVLRFEGAPQEPVGRERSSLVIGSVLVNGPIAEHRNRFGQALS